MMFSNFKKKSDYALIINWKFHKKNRWVSALTYYLVEAIIKEFNPYIISSQIEYELFKNKFKYIISMEPGWAAPFINYKKSKDIKIAMFLSDPHSKVNWLEKYVFKNDIDYIFSYYYHPFFYHFPNFPKERFVHLPWAIPKEFITKEDIKLNNSDISIFGGKKSKAYDVRNWCRQQENIKNFDFSGVENKKLTDKEYFLWLNKFDAIVAAGSSNPKYDLVTPKYFEIASAGSLVVGQYCKDLEILGFSNNNSIIFKKDNFNKKIDEYKKNPKKYLSVRKKGLELIRKKHTLDKRIETIKDILEERKK